MHNRSHIASWLLLAAYLPMLLASSLHVHHETIDLKDNCGECAGHIEVQHHHKFDCQYCNFLNLDYWGKDSSQSDLILPTTSTPAPLVETSPVLTQHEGVKLRAPPAA